MSAVHTFKNGTEQVYKNTLHTIKSPKGNSENLEAPSFVVLATSKQKPKETPCHFVGTN